MKRRILQVQHTLLRTAFDKWRFNAVVKENNMAEFRVLTLDTAERTQKEINTRVRQELHEKL
jgi:hypothetical protein